MIKAVIKDPNRVDWIKIFVDEECLGTVWGKPTIHYMRYGKYNLHINCDRATCADIDVNIIEDEAGIRDPWGYKVNKIRRS